MADRGEETGGGLKEAIGNTRNHVHFEGLFVVSEGGFLQEPEAVHQRHWTLLEDSEVLLGADCHTERGWTIRTAGPNRQKGAEERALRHSH